MISFFTAELSRCYTEGKREEEVARVGEAHLPMPKMHAPFSMQFMFITLALSAPGDFLLVEGVPYFFYVLDRLPSLASSTSGSNSNSF